MNISYPFQLAVKPNQSDNVYHYLSQRGFIVTRDASLMNLFKIAPVPGNPFTLQDAINLEKVVIRYYGTAKADVKDALSDNDSGCQKGGKGGNGRTITFG